MKMRGIGRLRRAARQLRNRFTPTALILLYHRVAELPSDPQLMCVTPQHFAEHLEILRKRGRPMRLQQLPQALGDASLSHRAVVVTFDDGYADNLHNAKPLLARYDIPATVFAVSRLLLQPGILPETLHLSVNGNPCQWELGESAHHSDDNYQRHRCWNVLERDDPTPRQQLYRSLCQLLRPLPEGERRKVLHKLLAWAGAESVARPPYRALSPDDLSRLAEGGLVEIGAHTVTHPVLSALPAAAQRDEIQGSKTYLEEILGRPVTSFSYPHGSRSDYTAETVAIIRKAGFACACSNFPGVVWRRTELLQLPRVRVRDWDGDEFARRLKGWFRG
jgi:peptidoglycan/xylan/chitin deacetylase (PgdA/CDA1 family)